MTAIDRNYEPRIVDQIVMSHMPTCGKCGTSSQNKYQPQPRFQKRWLWSYSNYMPAKRWTRHFKPSVPCPNPCETLVTGDYFLFVMLSIGLLLIVNTLTFIK